MEGSRCNRCRAVFADSNVSACPVCGLGSLPSERPPSIVVAFFLNIFFFLALFGLAIISLLEIISPALIADLPIDAVWDALRTPIIPLIFGAIFSISALVAGFGIMLGRSWGDRFQAIIVVSWMLLGSVLLVWSIIRGAQAGDLTAPVIVLDIFGGALMGAAFLMMFILARDRPRDWFLARAGART